MADAQPTFTRFDEVKLVTKMDISLTVDGLILSLQTVEAADVQAGRATTPFALKFLLPAEHATALGTALLEAARPLTKPARQ